MKAAWIALALGSLALCGLPPGAAADPGPGAATPTGSEETTSAQVILSPEDKARVARLSREIRCVACENEPISQSASDIAITMRERVRSLVAEGASDAEVRDWFAQRYGEFVLFRPEADDAASWLLWGAPFGLLIVGFGIGIALARGRSRGTSVTPVSPDAEDPQT